MAQGILWQLAAGQNFDPFGSAMRGYQAGSNQMRENEKRSVLQQLAMSGMSDAEAARALLPYDPQTASSLAQLGLAKEDRVARREDRQTDVQWRREEAERAQRNADRGFGLQGAQFNFQREQANQPVVQMIEDENGNKRPVLIQRNTGQMSYPMDASGGTGMPTQGPNNPYAPAGKVTDEQAKAAGYANRMAKSGKIIDELSGINSGIGTVTGTIDRLSVPWAGPLGDTTPGNWLRSGDRQKFNQAQRDFINAVLRRESGAVISDSEFANARQQYFPQPGDSSEVIAQKRANRDEATKGIMGAAGRTYRPPSEFASGQQSQQPRAPLRVNSIDEARRLPSGSTFIDPNGVTRRVP